MNRTLGWTIAVLVFIAAVAGAYWYRGQARPAVTPSTESTTTPPAEAPRAPQTEAPAPKPEPQIQFPIEQAQPAIPDSRPMPSLNESDALVADMLGKLLGSKSLQQFVQLQEIIRHVVATVDNLPREKAPPHLWPVRRTPGAFVTSGGEDNRSIAATNAARYRPFVQMVESIDARNLVAIYARLYPLFQQAYKDLGYPTGYFNDRLVEVIDHLLEAPNPPAQISLVQPKVFFLYAAPELESRSAGQKLLMRIGEENATKVKAKLREVRRALTAAGTKS